MGEADFCICQDCREIAIMERYEQVNWIKEHKGHDWNVLHGIWADDIDRAKKELADLLHFDQKEEE